MSEWDGPPRSALLLQTLSEDIDNDVEGGGGSSVDNFASTSFPGFFTVNTQGSELSSLPLWNSTFK